MPYYHVCPICGAYLDPGERCDCQDKKEKPSQCKQHQEGKADPNEAVARSASIVQKNEEENNYEI